MSIINVKKLQINFKKLLGIVIIGLILSGSVYAMESLKDLENKNKPWYKKLSIKKNPVSKYMKKRKECKRYADMADTLHIGKIRYKNCMEE